MKIKTISTLVSIVALTTVTNLSWAAGTLAGTDINNTASIAYSVGGANQTPIASAPGVGNSVPGTVGVPTTFKVDKKIDLNVTSDGDVNVVPSATGQQMTYVLTNQGNSQEDFSLTTTGIIAVGDQFDSSACTVTVPVGATVNLAPDATQAVTVECTIPGASAIVTNGAASFVDLLATVTGVTEDSGTADDPAAVETVFADDAGSPTDIAAGNAGVRNAKHSDASKFIINTAQVTVAKTSIVISDPTGGANPKRIPGAVVRYTITVANAALPAVTATGIVITDNIPNGITGTTALSNGVTYSTCGTSGDGIGSCSHAGGIVTSNSFDLTAGQTATMTIDVVVN